MIVSESKLSLSETTNTTSASNTSPTWSGTLSYTGSGTASTEREFTVTFSGSDYRTFDSGTISCYISSFSPISNGTYTANLTLGERVTIKAASQGSSQGGWGTTVYATLTRASDNSFTITLEAVLSGSISQSRTFSISSITATINGTATGDNIELIGGGSANVLGNLSVGGGLTIGGSLSVPSSSGLVADYMEGDINVNRLIGGKIECASFNIGGLISVSAVDRDAAITLSGTTSGCYVSSSLLNDGYWYYIKVTAGCAPSSGTEQTFSTALEGIFYFKASNLGVQSVYRKTRAGTANNVSRNIDLFTSYDSTNSRLNFMYQMDTFNPGYVKSGFIQRLPFYTNFA